MSEESAFLQAIRANIEDDLPRLVYADWLEERGYGARAEFIRVQCELARTPEWEPRYRALEDREHELLSAHERAFLGPNWPANHNWVAQPQEWFWRRGFVDELIIEHGQLIPANYLTQHPIQTITIVNYIRQPTDYLRFPDLQPVLSGLRCLHFDYCGPDFQSMVDFLNSDRLSNLEGLSFDGMSHHWDVCELLRRCPELCRRLRRLGTRSNTSERFRGTPCPEPPADPEQRRQLELAVINQLDAGLERIQQTHLDDRQSDLLSRWLLAGSPQRSVSLDWSVNLRVPGWKPDSSHLSFFGPPAQTWPKIRELSLNTHSDYRVPGRWDYAFLGHPMFERLESLAWCCPMIPEVLFNMFGSHGGWRSSVTRLSLTHVSNGVDSLLSSLQHSAVRELDLSGSRLGSDSLITLGRSRLANQLSTFRLYHVAFNPQDLVEALLANEWSCLRKLDLLDGVLSVDQLLHLVRQGHLPHLRQIRLSLERQDWAAFTELIERRAFTVLSLDILEQTDEFLVRLARMPQLQRINLLLLGPRNASDQALIELAESPYLSPICEVGIGGFLDYSARVREAFHDRLGRRVTE